MLVVFALLTIFLYNGLIQLVNTCNKAWANMEVLLKQRSNEIPNLISCVKGYMKHEKETLELLTKARSMILQDQSLTRKAAVDDVMTHLLKTLFAVAEDYPELKANENFLHLQQRLTGLENELSDRREFFNDAVMIYNTRIQSFPDLLIAKVFHFNPKTYFKATKEDKQYIKVNL